MTAFVPGPAIVGSARQFLTSEADPPAAPYNLSEAVRATRLWMPYRTVLELCSARPPIRTKRFIRELA